MNQKTRYELLLDVEKEIGKSNEDWDSEDVADALAMAFNEGCDEGCVYESHIRTRIIEDDQKNNDVS